MSYETKLDFEKRIELKNAGITIGVSRDGSEFGKLHVSKGGVKWLPKGHSKKGIDLSWEDFVAKLTADEKKD